MTRPLAALVLVLFGCGEGADAPAADEPDLETVASALCLTDGTAGVGPQSATPNRLGRSPAGGTGAGLGTNPRGATGAGLGPSPSGTGNRLGASPNLQGGVHGVECKKPGDEGPNGDEPGTDPVPGGGGNVAGQCPNLCRKLIQCGLDAQQGACETSCQTNAARIPTSAVDCILNRTCAEIGQCLQ